MKKRRFLSLGFALAFFGLVSSTYGREDALVHSRDTLRIERQTSGPFKVNAYLVYDIRTKDAALIDAGSSIDRLLASIGAQSLKLKYIFLTHLHQDHVAGIPALKEKYPHVKFCCSRMEFADRKSYQSWRTLFQASSVALWEKDPAMAALMDFEYARLPEPDVFLDDGREFPLGGWKIKAMDTPGHSRGGVTFSAADVVFPGDLLLYHATGFMEYPLCSKDKIVESIRKLYAAFPDAAVVFSGHGEASTIGFEKSHNQNVTVKEVKWTP